MSYFFTADLIYRRLHVESDLLCVLMGIIMENSIMTNLFLLYDTKISIIFISIIFVNIILVLL
jgi:hypothetical protein